MILIVSCISLSLLPTNIISLYSAFLSVQAIILIVIASLSMRHKPVYQDVLNLQLSALTCTHDVPSWPSVVSHLLRIFPFRRWILQLNVFMVDPIILMVV